MSVLKKIALVGVLGLSLGLAGCQGWPWSQEEVNAKVAAIQELCKEGCNFLVSAKSVVDIVAAANPAAASARAIADAICEQVNKSTTEKAAPANCPWGQVNGVCIEGKRVK